MSIDIRPSLSFDEDDAPSINLNNGNASVLLSSLGFSREDIERIASEGDTFTAEDILGRVLVAQVLSGSIEHRPMVREGNWIDFGTDPDYIIFRLTEVRALAEWARDRQRFVDIY